jgi:hypothetical protein
LFYLVAVSQSFLQRAQVFQNNLLYHHSFKKMLKRRSYRVFLQLNTGYLPSLNSLQKGRKWLAIASFLSLTPMCLGTIIYWPWVESDIIFLPISISGLFSPAILCGACFIILLSFSLMFDYVIHKRFKDKALMDW